MWNRIARFILKNKYLLLCMLIAVTGFMGYHGRNVEMSYEYAALLPEKDSIFQENKRFVETFGAGADVIVLGVQDTNFFELNRINRWNQLSDELKEIDGVEATLSVGNAYDMIKNKEEKKFTLEPIFPDRFKSQIEIDSLKNRLDALPFYAGQLFDSPGHTYMMAITVNKEKMASPAREQMVDEIREVALIYQAEVENKVRFSGMPYIRVMTAQQIKKEFMKFTVFALLVVVLILFFFFRTFRQVVFPLIVVVCGVIWTVGTMSLLGYKITLLTGMVPPLLIVIGVPNCIFLINKYHSEYLSHGNKVRALQRTIVKIGNATLLTNITTASGFATFLITSSQILREFGLVASLNIMALFLMSLILIPIAFSFLSPPREKDTRHLDSNFFNKLINHLVLIATHHRKTAYISFALSLVIGVFGISKMTSTGYMVDDIEEDTEIFQDLKFFESHFDGLMPLEINIDTKKPNGATRASTLKKMEQFSNELSELDEISGAISLVPMIKFAKQAFYNGKEKYYKLPTSREQNFIMSYAMNSSEGNANEMKAFMDSTRQQARISFRVKDIGTDRMENLLQLCHEKADKYFPKDKYDVHVVGTSVVFAKGTEYLVTSLFQSLGLAIILIAFFMAMMFNSGRMVFLSLIPNIVPLVFTAAVMGYAGIPIKASTILVFSIAFGISVDDTIHFLAKYRQELRITNWNIGQSVILALRETGVSMIYTSLVLFFGFGIFSFSDFGGTVALGILVSMTLLVALFSNLILLPCLLMDLQKSATTEYFNEPFLEIFDEEEDIDHNMLEIEIVKPVNEAKPRDENE